MSKLLMFLGLAVTLQLSQHRYEVIAQSQPLHILGRPVTPAPVNGFSVQNPLRATFYAFKRGAMKVLVPFEITIITGNGAEPELSAPNQPISGQLRPQQRVNHYPPYNGNAYQKYPQTHSVPTYYRPPTYQPYAQQYVQPYAYAPYHAYNGYNNYNNYNGYNQLPYRNPYYRARQPWPQYRGQPLQHNTTNNGNPQNYSGNNTAINIINLVNNTANATHPPNAPNATPQNQATLTAAPQNLVPETPTTTTTEATTTTPLPVTTTVLPIVPELKQDDVETEIPNFDEEAEASYMQPNYVWPNERILLPGMNVNGEYIDQINGN